MHVFGEQRGGGRNRTHQEARRPRPRRHAAAGGELFLCCQRMLLAHEGIVAVNQGSSWYIACRLSPVACRLSLPLPRPLSSRPCASLRALLVYKKKKESFGSFGSFSPDTHNMGTTRNFFLAHNPCRRTMERHGRRRQQPTKTAAIFSDEPTERGTARDGGEGQRGTATASDTRRPPTTTTTTTGHYLYDIVDGDSCGESEMYSCVSGVCCCVSKHRNCCESD